MTPLRPLAARMIAAALAAVDPVAAVRTYLQRHPAQEGRIARARGRVWVVGAGKAGAPMAAAVVDRLPGRVAAGVVVVPRGHTGGQAQVGPIRLLEAGHPLPDAAGLAAAGALLELADRAGEDDLVLALVSGGASALLPAPPPPVALADLRAITGALLRRRAAIGEINAVRRHLSCVQGGRLAARAAPAAVLALVLSDVVGDDLHAIGSGPTVADPTTYADALAVLARHDLLEGAPPAVRGYLEAGLSGHVPESIKPGDPRLARAEAAVIASGPVAAAAAVEEAGRAGARAEVRTTRLEGEARAAGRWLAALARELRRGAGGLPACWVLAGETTVDLGAGPVGRGGRNQEAALAAALALAGCPDVLVACVGTDGVDGDTDAAGALADGDTCARAQQRGLDPADCLARHDSHVVFAALDDLIRTGPTLTNVGDLALVLAR